MTEIITTINTSTISKKLLLQMLLAGSSIFRINMSHSSIDSALWLAQEIQEIAEASQLAVKIMIDLPGPEIRLANLPNSLNLKSGSSLKIYFLPCPGNYHFTSAVNKEVIAEGDSFYLQDGDFSGLISAINEDYLTITVKNEGVLRPNCHFSIPGKTLYQEFLSEHDQEIIRQTAQLKPDFFALSFVNSAADIKVFNDFYHSLQLAHQPKILTKLETAKGLLNLDQIIAHSDYIYIARGDLGIEVSIPHLPSLQKFISLKCNESHTPFFVATQMLESMITKTMPTRAEISDVANALFDGASGVTLSDETAIGQYPIETIKWMKMIIDSNSGNVEANINSLINL